MNIYEAIKAYEAHKNELTNSAKVLFFEIVIKLNKNFWKPALISRKEFSFSKTRFYAAKQELTSCGIIASCDGFFTIPENSHIRDNESATEENELSIRNHESHIRDDNSHIR